jgi:hypothetical protein
MQCALGVTVLKCSFVERNQGILEINTPDLYRKISCSNI